uniref:Polyketide synthase n=1 Tax=Peronospora matthiolae TaxID=2874970 RepID=A0AAV1V3Y0_9STRA
MNVIFKRAATPKKIDFDSADRSNVLLGCGVSGSVCSAATFNQASERDLTGRPRGVFRFFGSVAADPVQIAGREEKVASVEASDSADAF